MQKIAKLQEISVFSTLLHSRIHLLKTFSGTTTSCYVKRDDELGFGISGSKLRKYSSLIPYLLKENYQEALIIGGAYSNNVLGLSQLLIENQIKPILFLLGDEAYKRHGNLLLTSLLVDDSQIHWIRRKDWNDVEEKAYEYAKNHDPKVAIIPEGACMFASLPGALTLVLDILENEKQLQKPFTHLFIDAGTGLTAIAVILAFAWLNKKTKIHVLLLADTKEAFTKKLKQFQVMFEQLIEDQLNEEVLRQQFILYSPTVAPSFGAVNKTVLQTIKTIAREEGFFTDPIYSAKLFFEAKKIIREKAITGDILIIHAGGALTLMGFQEQLAK